MHMTSKYYLQKDEQVKFGKTSFILLNCSEDDKSTTAAMAITFRYVNKIRKDGGT